MVGFATGNRARWLELVGADSRARYTEATASALADVTCHRWVLDYALDVGGQAIAVEERGFLVRSGEELVRAIGVLRRAGEVAATPTLAEPELRAFVELIPQLAWAADAAGWIHYYNQRWYDFTGTTANDMAGWGWVAVHDPYDLPRMLKIWRGSLESGHPWEDEFRLRSADGTLRWHLSRANPVRDASGTITAWFGTNTDIHDQKLAAEEYSRLLASEQRLRREAEASSRAKDEFLAMVSHELRTPLHVIIGWVEMLRGGNMPPQKRDDALAKIAANAHLQAKLVEDILDVSRIITDKLTLDSAVHQFADVVHSAVEAARPIAEAKGVALEILRVAERLAVRGDAGRLQQVTGNLLSNAIKFTPAGGKVTVTLDSVDDLAVFVVEDTGVGFEQSFALRMFDRFRQGDGSATRKHEGLGLGLAIVRELVQRHGGTVDAVSDGPGRGARFRVCLPVAGDVEARPIASKANDAGVVQLTGVRVLVVDDNPDARDMLGEMLLSCGASVTLAAGVHEALRAFKLGPPDVIVSDIGMPELDGYSLVERIRALPDAHDRTTPIIALTAYASHSDNERAIAAGFDAYLAKPADHTGLSRMIGSLATKRAT